MFFHYKTYHLFGTVMILLMKIIIFRDLLGFGSFLQIQRSTVTAKFDAESEQPF